MPEDPGEQQIIDTFLRGRTQPRLSPLVDAGDDAAVLSDGTLVSTDAFLEGVHWTDRAAPEDIGWKAIAVNASDIGAMGGRPTWATLALALPPTVDHTWVAGVARGVHQACARFGIALVGGDTTRSTGPRMLTITIGGAAARPVLRSGASANQSIYVTGVLGEAAMGFFADGPGKVALDHPHPPVDFGAALGEAGLVTAMMDLSDGLSRDLPRLCRASGVGARIQPEMLPLSPILAGVTDPLPYQVAFGDDYQLLFVAPNENHLSIATLAHTMDVRITRIGTTTHDTTVQLVGRSWPMSLFSHFEPTTLRGEP